MKLFRLPLGTKHVDADVAQELEFHLEMRAEELMRSGLTRAAALAQARAEFGDLGEARRELGGIGRRREGRRARLEWWREVLQDARIALRSYGRDPLFTAVVLLTLGLGIGANTTIFSLVHAALLRPLPYAQPDRLVTLVETVVGNGSRESAASYPDFQDWRAERRSFAGVEGYDGTNVSLSTAIGAERVQGARVSPGFFTLLGVRPVRGHWFTEADDAGGGGHAVILSYGAWQRRFGADPDIVGRSIAIDGVGYEVRGVAPPGLMLAPAGELEVWLPLGRTNEVRAHRFDHWVWVIARLQEGVTLEQARLRMAGVMSSLAVQYPESNAGRGVRLTPLAEAISTGTERPLLILFGAVALVLLIACSNVATLILARSITRSRELAVRAAIGAARGRILRQLLTENLLLALLGAAAGAILAVFGVRTVLATLPVRIRDQFAALQSASVNLTVLGFTIAVALGVGVLFGLAPALLGSRHAPAELLRSDTRVGSGRGQHRLRDALVVGELALTLVLLVGAGLLGRSVLALLRLDPGFRPEQVAIVRVALAGPSYEERQHQARFFEELLTRTRGLPGVAAIGAVSSAPLQGSFNNSFHVDGDPEPPPSARPEATTRAVAGDYFSALRIPVLQGRAVNSHDDLNAPYAVTISRDLARRLFGNRPAVGRRIRFYHWQDSAWTIVGVVGDVKTDRLDEPSIPTVYYSHFQGPANRMSLVVRATGDDAEALLPAVRREAQALDPTQAVYGGASMEQYVQESAAVASRRFLLVLLSAFAAAALMLALIGVYGVIAYSVAQRTREVAIRVALGATAASIITLISRSGVRLLVAGLGIGTVAALGLTRGLRSLLYGVKSADPWTYGLVALLLGVVVLVAGGIPARRATRVDPALTLRSE